jgi:hypothetical protein
MATAARMLVFAAAAAAAEAAAQLDPRAATAPPACNLTGTWCCEETTVVQTGNALAMTAAYGTGVGTISGYAVAVNFSNAPAPLNGTVDAGCANIAWSNGATWARSMWPGPATPAPAWVRNLSIYELNPRGFTSPNGTGADGSGSGTWASLAARLPYLSALGVTGLWVAGSVDADSHFFYNLWSVYSTRDPTALDPALGPPSDFVAFVDAAHAAGIRVFLDAVTHGIMNDSAVVRDHPDWFAGGSWGMTDYNYSNPEFFAWWSGVWAGWVTSAGVDGYRLDIADTDGELAGFDAAARAGEATGRSVAIFGESRRYHFGQHDATWSVGGFADLVGVFSPTPCFVTTQISCHDHGWESPPGNYYAMRGSRAWFGYAGVFSFNIPVFFGGEEFDADPVSLPALQRDLFGGGGPGGWMYGTALQWGQITANASKAAMLADVSRMFAIASAHADVLHHDRCGTAIVRVPVTPAPGTPPAATVAVPYARYIDGVKAVLVFANADPGVDAALVAAVPLAAMNLAGAGPYAVTDVWGSNGGGTVTVTEAGMAALRVAVPRDLTPGGGLAVLVVEPVGGGA